MMKQFTMILLVIAGLTFLTSCNEPANKEQVKRTRILTVEVNPVDLENVKVTLDDGREQDDKSGNKYGFRIDERMHMLKITADGHEPVWFQIPADENYENISLPAVTMKPITMPVILETNPPGAITTLDHEDVGVTPVFLSAVKLGKHKVTFKFKDNANSPITFNFNLTDKDYNKEIKKVAVSTLGNVILMTDPGAQVLVNGRDMGEADANGRLELNELIEGEHRAEIRKKYYNTRFHTFKCVREETVTVHHNIN